MKEVKFKKNLIEIVLDQPIEHTKCTQNTLQRVSKHKMLVEYNGPAILFFSRDKYSQIPKTVTSQEPNYHV